MRAALRFARSAAQVNRRQFIRIYGAKEAAQAGVR